MKKLTPLVVVVISLIGLGLLWNTLGAGALSLPDDEAGHPAPTNTPAAPVEGARSMIYRALPSLTVGEAPEQAQLGGVVTEQEVQGDIFVQQRYQYADDLRQAGVRFQTLNPGVPVQPTNTPVAPEGDRQSTVGQATLLLDVEGIPEETQSEAPISKQWIQDIHDQQLYQHATILRQEGMRFQL